MTHSGVRKKMTGQARQELESANYNSNASTDHLQFSFFKIDKNNLKDLHHFTLKFKINCV